MLAISLTVGLVFFAYALSGLWSAESLNHTAVDTAAAMLAGTAGAQALARYYSRPDNGYLFLGAGFIGTALLDGYHAAVTTALFADLFPSPPPSLFPWSWNAPRTFLAVLMVLFALRRSRALSPEPDHRISAPVVFLFVGLLAVLSFLFFAFVPLPRAYYPGLPFGRPQELVAAALFGWATVAHWRDSDWRIERSDRLLLCSLLVGFFSQALFMSQSYSLSDPMFELAHLLKIASYGIVVTMLLLETYGLYRQADTSVEKLSKLNRELENERGLLRSIMDNVPDLIYQKDRQGRFVSANRAHLGRLGLELEQEILGKTDFDLRPPELAKRVFADEQDAIRSGQSIEALERLPDSEGRYRWFRSTKVPTVDRDGAATGIVGIARDITELKEAQESLERENEQRSLAEASLHRLNQALESKNDELETIVYVASHDLRSPLVNIQGFSDELERAGQRVRDLVAGLEPSEDVRRELEVALGEDVPEALMYIQTSAAKIDRLLEGLLKLSRLGRAALNSRSIDMPLLLGRVVRENSSQIRQCDADLRIDDLPCCIGDDALVAQVFSNLIDNALKYRSPERSPEILITGEIDSDASVFRVRDNGIGIRREHQEKIFEVFHQLDPRPGSGEGMGLAIVQRILIRLDGSISVDSTPGVGSEFVVRLPACSEGNAERPDRASEVASRVEVT